MRKLLLVICCLGLSAAEAPQTSSRAVISARSSMGVGFASSLWTFAGNPTGGDDTAMVQAVASTIPPGGVLAFAPGRTYNFSSQANFNGIPCSVSMPTTVHIEVNGATLAVPPSLTLGGIFCWVNPGVSDYEIATLYATSNIARGDTKITLSTAGNTSHFNVGDYIYFQGETSDYNDRGVNQVTAINSGTGDLTLAWPTGKSYTSSPKVANVQSVTQVGMTLHGPGTILPGKIQVVIGQQLVDAVISDLTVWTNTAVVGEPFQFNYSTGLQFRNNRITSNFGPLIDFGGRVCTDCVASGNVVSLIASSTGALPTTLAVNCGEGAERCVFSMNHVESVGNAAANPTGVDLSNSYDAVWDASNVVNMGPSIAGAALATNNGSGFGAVNPRIAGTFRSSASYALILGASDQDTVSSPSISLTGASAQGIHVIGPANLTGGSCTGMASGAYCVIVEGTGAQCSQITGMRIVAAAPGSSGAGIGVVDPGSQQACDPVITANTILNYTTRVNFTGGYTHNANAVVNGNPGVTNH